MNQFFPLLVKHIGRNEVVIFDADGIYYLNQHPQQFAYLQNFKTITPNKQYLSFIKTYMNTDIHRDFQYEKNQQIHQLSQKFRKVHLYSLLFKGHQYIILGPKSFVLRTSGGKSDVEELEIYWLKWDLYALWNFELGPVLESRIVRKATGIVFQNQGWSMTAPCIIKQISRAEEKKSIKKVEDNVQFIVFNIINSEMLVICCHQIQSRVANMLSSLNQSIVDIIFLQVLFY